MDPNPPAPSSPTPSWSPRSASPPSVPDQTPLEPAPEVMEQMLELVGERVVHYLRSLPGLPTHFTDHGEHARDWVDAPPPETGRPIEEILDLLFERVIPCALNTASPGYFAYVPGGGLFSAALGEFVAAAVNRYAGVWAAAPGPVELETRVLRWLATLMGYPGDALGVVTTGASLSALLAVVAAREKHLGEEIHTGCAYLSSEAHHTLSKAARIAGIPRHLVRTIPVDDQFRMRLDALQQAVAEDRRSGLRPFFLCGSAGTVNTGSIDPLRSLADIARREQMWFHVDGAYGGVFRLVDELIPSLRGIERSDSVAIDPHKGLFVAYGTGVLLVRDVSDLQRAFRSSAPYLPPLQEGVRHVDFCDLSPELSRDWRGLRLWLPLVLHGIGAFRRALRTRRELAVLAWDRLSRRDDVEIATPPELSLFAFRQRHPGAPVEEENRINREILERVNAPRRVLLTGTVLGGRFYIRICVLHLRTDRERVLELLDLLVDALDATAPGRAE